MTDDETFIEVVKRVAAEVRERAKHDPTLRHRLECADRKRYARSTHKRWTCHWDVYGAQDDHCARCGTWASEYGEMSEGPWPTCDEVMRLNAK